jgi:hypothetical protein
MASGKKKVKAPAHKAAPRKPAAKKPATAAAKGAKSAPKRGSAPKAVPKPAKKATQRPARKPAAKAGKRASPSVQPKAVPTRSAPRPATPAPRVPVAPSPSAPRPTSGARPQLDVSDEAVLQATRRTWDQWGEALDALGAMNLPHSDIARLVMDRFRLGPWWSQMVTVGYEQMRGLREKHQKSDGFSISATKTLTAHPERVYSAWNVDGERYRWLGAALKVRSVTHPTSIRLAGSDGLSQVVVMLRAKGAKTQVSVEHSKLKDAADAQRMKGFWTQALDRLRTAVERG